MIDAALVALRIMRANWKAIAVGAVIAWLGLSLLAAKGDARHFRKRWEAEKAAHALTVANVERATEKTRAEQTAAARAAETRFAKIEREKDDAIRTRIAAARALTAERLRTKAATDHSGSGGTGDLPGAPDAAVSADGAGGPAFVDEADALICTENTIKLQGWQDWHAAVSEDR